MQSAVAAGTGETTHVPMTVISNPRAMRIAEAGKAQSGRLQCRQIDIAG
jgi:hypothetical protein